MSTRFRPRARGGLLLAALVAAGAARAGTLVLPVEAGGAFSVPARSLQEARFSATVRQQYDFSCGSAALSTLLTHHYGVPVSEQTVFEEMYRQGDQARIRQQGFSLLDMKRYLEQHGFTADGFQASLDALREAAIPAIVLVNENGYNHFVVVKGLQGGRVLVGDPSGGTRALPQATFEAVWVNHILFVINNRMEQARFNLASDWRVAPSAMLGEGVPRNGLAGVVLPRLGPSDF